MHKKLESYQEMKIRHQKEVNAFPIHFAFGDEQIKRKFNELGLDPEKDLDKITVIPGTGGFILKKDEDARRKMCERHYQEFQDAIAADKNGTGFIYQMFRYELANYEFGYTGEADDALAALGYTEAQIDVDPALKRGFEKAKQDIWNQDL